MKWIEHITNMNMEDVNLFFDKFEALGPFPGIILPFLEAFLPILPLFLFIIANASAYGFLWGFFYSWLGVCAGSLLVFTIFRRFGNRLRGFVHRRLPKTERVFSWIENLSFTPLFLLCCFPFTPSFFINMVSGLSTIPFRTFALAIFLGKAVMIFVLAFIGHDLEALVEQPWRLVLVIAVIVGLWFGGKRLEVRYKM